MLKDSSNCFSQPLRKTFWQIFFVSNILLSEMRRSVSIIYLHVKYGSGVSKLFMVNGLHLYNAFLVF